MRIAYVCADPGIPVFGSKGASVHVQEVLRALLGRGASVDLFAARFDGPPPSPLDAVRRHALHRPEGDPRARERQGVANNARLVELLRSAGPFDLIYERQSLWSFGAMEFARVSGVPGLLEVNAPLIDEQARHRVLVDRDTAERCASRAFRAAAATLAVSPEVADYVATYTARPFVHVVPNAVDPQRFSPAIPAGCPARAGARTLGFTGSLKPWHGLDVLLDAFARVHRAVPRSRLLVVGDGPGRPDLERAVHRLSLAEAVVFTGAVAPADVPGLLTSMDVAAAPYPDRAGFYFSPLKLFEYMAAGLSIVASRIGQIAEVIEDDVTGVLCPPSDAQALADSVLALFADPARRYRLGAAARRRACEAHTWDGVASRILEIAANARTGSRTVVGL